MPEAYSRQSSFSNGDLIDAALFNAEFNQLVNAFKSDVGHNHDGTPGAGAPVPFIQSGTSGVYVDTTTPASPKIIFKLNGVVVNVVSSSGLTDTTKVNHTPASTGVPVALNTYLDGLQVAVGNASSDAAQAAADANRAEAAAALLGLPTLVSDGSTYDIPNSSVAIDIICLGNATINLPTVLTPGFRYSIRVSSKATMGKKAVLLNPSFNIIGDLRTLGAGDNLELNPKDIVVLDVISSTELEII